MSSFASQRSQQFGTASQKASQSRSNSPKFNTLESFESCISFGSQPSLYHRLNDRSLSGRHHSFQHLESVEETPLEERQSPVMVNRIDTNDHILPITHSISIASTLHQDSTQSYIHSTNSNNFTTTPDPIPDSPIPDESPAMSTRSFITHPPQFNIQSASTIVQQTPYKFQTVKVLSLSSSSPNMSATIPISCPETPLTDSVYLDTSPSHHQTCNTIVSFCDNLPSSPQCPNKQCPNQQCPKSSPLFDQRLPPLRSRKSRIFLVGNFGFY